MSPSAKSDKVEPGINYQKYSEKTIKGMYTYALVFMILTIPISIYRNDLFLMAFHTGFIIELFIIQKTLRNNMNFQLASLGIIFPSFILLLYALWTGTTDTITMVLIFPVIVYFLADEKSGTLIILMFAIIMIIILFLKKSMLPQGIVSITVIMITYTTVSGLAYLFEANRCKLQNEIYTSSLMDFLCDTWNRRCFDRDFEWFIEDSNRYNTTFSILLFDVDNFKNINDTYGHATGDDVLKDIVKNVKIFLRSSDILYRIGGDEFIILLRNTDIKGAEEFALRLLKMPQESELLKSHMISLSIGLTQYQSHPGKIDTLSIIDKALYLAKEKGKNRIEIL